MSAARKLRIAEPKRYPPKPGTDHALIVAELEALRRRFEHSKDENAYGIVCAIGIVAWLADPADQVRYDVGGADEHRRKPGVRLVLGNCYLNKPRGVR